MATAAVGLAACAPPSPPPTLPAAPPTLPPIREKVLKPIGTLDLQIVDFTATPSADHKTVTVTGTIVNRGTRASRTVSVHVEARDKTGAVVLSADAVPQTQAIEPDATTTFSVRFANRPSIDSYRAEAIAR